MKRFVKYAFVSGNLIIFIFCHFLISFAQNSDEKQAEEQYQLLRRYEDIKKTKDKEYIKGVYNDDQKDYVNGWIGEDINYQKRVIKLKSDYRTWAEGKISRKEKVNFMDYEPLKMLTRVEKQILLEYHNKLFSTYEKKKTVFETKVEKKKTKKNTMKKSVDETPDILKQVITFQPDNISNAENTNNNSYVSYLFPGIAGFLLIVGISILIFKKLYKKSKPKKICIQENRKAR